MIEDSPVKLRILQLEDNPADAELAAHSLHKAGIDFEIHRVESREELERELESFRPDIILLDYSLPHYSGADALQLVRKRHPDIPLVMVTGALGDESVADMLKAGARDYVLKDNLKRLPHAVEHALAMEAGIRARKAAEAQVRETAQCYDSAVSSMRDAFIVMNGDTGQVVEWNPAAEIMFGYSRDEAMGRDVHELVAPQRDQEASKMGMREFFETRQGPVLGTTIELVARHKDGREFPVELSLSRSGAAARCQVVGVVRDISERKRAEEALSASAKNLRNSLVGTILATSKAVEARDPYTAGHQQRVSSLQALLPRKWGLMQRRLRA